MEDNTLVNKTVLITGGARRLGAVIARLLHRAGMNLALHYRSSTAEAETLQDELNCNRPGSVLLLQGNLLDISRLPTLIERVIDRWKRLDLLVNNASSFYPTPLGTVTETQWDDLLGSNLKAPFFLAQAAGPHLQKVRGNIINMVDIHAYKPMNRHAVYCVAKAGLIMLTQSLAMELGPQVRVNGIAPGAILWPESGASKTYQARVLSRVVLQRPGDPDDIARTVLFLAAMGDYITGQIINVDGGRTLSM